MRPDVFSWMVECSIWGPVEARKTRRLGYVIGLMSVSLTGPRHAMRWTPRFNRKLVKTPLGGEEKSLRGMADHMSSLRHCCAACEGLNPGIMGSDDCEGLFTHQKTKKMLAGRYLARHFFENPAGLGGGRTG